jgi:hypothetical protein
MSTIASTGRIGGCPLPLPRTSSTTTSKARAESGEGGDESSVVLFLALVKARVFQAKHLAIRQRCDSLFP